MSKRMIEEMISDVFGADIALGTVSDVEQRISAAIEAPVLEVAEALKNTPVNHVDETGWREDKKKAWLWVMASPLMAVFTIRRSR